jgi:hypothetical protein
MTRPTPVLLGGGRPAYRSGFGRCEVLAIDNPLFRFYRLGI